MNFFSQVRLGVVSYSDAHRLILRYKLWGYIIAPGIINMIIFAVSTILIFKISDNLVTNFLNFVAGFFNVSEFAGNNIGWISFIISLLIKALFLLSYLSIYKYIVLFLMSPVLAMMSERVEKIISGKDYPFLFSDFIKDMLRGMLLSLRNLAIEICLLIVIYLLSIAPVINLLCPLLAFYISSYYYGFSMLDYSNERKRFSLKKSILFIRLHRGVAVGNGAIFYLLLMIPFAGWLIAPAYSVTAAAIAREKIPDA